MVQVLTRHGARTPLHITKSIPHIWECNQTEFQLFYDRASHPVKVHVSHGNSIFLGDCHVGQLLGRGSDALYRLGKHMRKIYVNSMKFLPTNFVSKTVNFRSTSTHRTLHSAMSFIDGLYPGNSLVTINVADKFIDPWRRGSAICPNLKKNIEMVRQSEDYRAKFASRIPVLAEAALAINAKTKSAPDIVMAARCDGQTLKTNVSESVFDRAALLKADQQKYVFAHPSVFPLMFSFAAGEIVNEMIARINGESFTKFIHWSAHDGNIFGYLGYLGSGSDKLPPYGSYIVTELWRTVDTGEFLVRVIFNGDPVKLNRLGGETTVGFSKFAGFVRDNMPDLIDDCNFNLQKFKKGCAFKAEEN